MTDPLRPSILIVDDEERMAEALAVAMDRSGYRTATCTSAERALELFQENPADCVVTDQRMPGMDGIELMRRIKRISPSTPVILVTAYGEISSAVAAMREGAFDYITKPFDNSEVRHLVSRALEITRLQRENRSLRRELAARFGGEIVAESAAMKSVLALIDRAAASKAPVLLQGESGTGKELLARRLHYGSERVGRPFVAVNCRAFSEGVLESELFGHEKGAFTGADAERQGCFERADGGTLFLDEIGEVDAAFQVKILRVIQESEVLRVGGRQPKRIDVRIVSASNRDLSEEIREERFREDLYFRINVIPVHIPPLRERREDILPLAGHFLARNAADGTRGFTLSEESERLLLDHGWPGNVRELENAIERACVLAASPVLQPEDLLLDTTRRGPRTESGEGASSLQDRLETATIQALREALDAADGQRNEAARLLGIDRTTLYRLLKRHGLS